MARLLAAPALCLALHYRLLHPDGTWHWLAATCTSLFHDPTVQGLVTIARDITAPKRAEAAVRASEERLRRALAIETVGVIFFDPEGPITDANAAFFRMIGYRREALAHGHLRWDVLTPPEFLPASRAAIDEL